MAILGRSLLKRVVFARALLKQALLAPRYSTVANVSPTAAFSSAAGSDTLTFNFTDTSSDSDGSIVSWLWDFGDSTTSTLQNPSHTYAVQGTKTVTLTVTDNRGGTAQVQHTVAPTPIIPSVLATGNAASVLGANASLAVPGAYATNDLVYVFIECLQTETISTPAGYTQITDSPQTAAGCKLQVFRKRLSGIATPGSGEANVPLAGHTNHVLGIAVVVRNAQATGTPEDVTAGGIAASSTAVSIPGDTTTQPNTLVLAACAAGTDIGTAQFSAWANADLAGVAEVADAFTTDGGGGGVGVASGTKAAAGAYGATTATLAAASSQGLISFAVLGKGTA